MPKKFFEKLLTRTKNSDIISAYFKSDDEDGRFALTFRERLFGAKPQCGKSRPITSELKMQKIFSSSVLRERCVSAKGLLGSAEGRPE